MRRALDVLGFVGTLAAAVMVAYLLTGLMSCASLPPVKVCPDGTVTTGTCPSPSPEPGPTPTPAPQPTPTPSTSPTPAPSPTPTPTPLPTPSPSPSPCVPQNGGTDCQPACNLFWQDAIARKAGGAAECHWHPVLGGTLLIGHDGPPTHRPCPGGNCCAWEPTPAEIGAVPRAVDRSCNLLKMPERHIVHPPNSGYLGLQCQTTAPTPCPSPTPSPGPTPTPGPAVDDIPAVCPRLDAIHLNLHNIMGPDFQPRPSPVAGGYVVIDATPQFGCGDGECFSRNRCNDEKHWICTRSGTAHETQDPEHLAAAAADRACQNYRRCEDPNGYCWGMEGGSPGHTQHDGYQFRVGPLRSGVHRVWVNACGGSHDHHGQPVPTRPGTLGVITFSVP